MKVRVRARIWRETKDDDGDGGFEGLFIFFNIFGGGNFFDVILERFSWWEIPLIKEGFGLVVGQFGFQLCAFLKCVNFTLPPAL